MKQLSLNAEDNFSECQFFFQEWRRNRKWETELLNEFCIVEFIWRRVEKVSDMEMI